MANGCVMRGHAFLQTVVAALSALTELIIEGFHDCVQELGCGFGEAVCQRAFKIVLSDKGLLVESGLQLDVHFRGQEIGNFTTDLVVERLVLVEVKATSRIEDVGRAQLLNYLKCAGGGVGLLANFGMRPEIKRYVMGDPTKAVTVVFDRVEPCCTAAGI